MLQRAEGGTPETKNLRLCLWRKGFIEKKITPGVWKVFKPPDNKE